MRDVAFAAALLLAAAGSAARAEPALGNWRVDTGSDGQVTASLHASNKLITGGGALGYSPVLTLACRPDGDPRWSEWLQLNDAVSASRKITISVVVDGGSKFDESWSVGSRGRMLVRDGDDGIKRLVSANRLTLSWRFGLLSGRGEADFELAGLSEAIGQIAASCKIDPP
ncbi:MULTISPECIES: type VI secretion protein [unclassified Mesorhizobium]|uniref:type VI secretion protein n=1 Tax=unclassified Mesorhizobium TaxID=325217 RepID=UPI001FEF3C3D|nr:MULTISPECIES: type VI secretion protein [unclassified Mesorhizobium]